MNDKAGGPKPLHVVMAITHTEAGGLREIWQDVAGGLQQRGLNTGLVALYPRAGEIAEARADGWSFIRPQAPRGGWAALGLLWGTIGWLRRHRPDFVIAAMPFSNVFFALACMATGGRTRVILSHHTPSFTYQAMLNRIDRWTGRLPSVVGIVCVSDAVGASFDTWPQIYRAKRRTIHNALPERIEHLADSIGAGRPRNRAMNGLVVAVGRLSRQKNYPQLIRAMALLPQARLEIIGTGEDEADLRGLIAELALQDRVTLVGQMPREDALRRAAQADVFVQVSLFEGHSLALIEATRLGLPLVVSQVPVQIEGITGNDGEPCGLAVPLGDDRALADALRSLLDNPATYAHWAASSARLGQGRSSRELIGRYARLLQDLGVRLPDPAPTTIVETVTAKENVA